MPQRTAAKGTKNQVSLKELNSADERKVLLIIMVIMEL